MCARGSHPRWESRATPGEIKKLTGQVAELKQGETCSVLTHPVLTHPAPTSPFPEPGDPVTSLVSSDLGFSSLHKSHL